jgi:glycosyltransferase involved in cell wall biosynthesis
MMRTVLVYRSDLLPYSQTFIREQILAYKGWRGVLVGRTLLDQLNLNGLEVRLLESEKGSPGGMIARIRRRFGNVSQCGSLRESWLDLLRRERPSLLHAHFGTDAIAAEPIARALDIPMIVTLHGYDINTHREWWESGRGGALLRRYPCRLLDLAAQPNVHFIAVSDAIRQRAIVFGINSDKLTTSYIGVDVSKFTPGTIPVSSRAPRVLFVGRLVENKGCEYLLQAMQIVKTHISNAELTIVGDGPLRADLETLSVRLGVDARFVGIASAEGVKNELDNASVFCLPSIRADNGDAEGFPLVLLEAQAAGLPVVSSAFGGAKEGILHEKSGYCLEEKDVLAMANGLVEILAHRDKAVEMGLAGRQFVSAKFNVQKCTENLEACYDNFVQSSQKWASKSFVKLL